MTLSEFLDTLTVSNIVLTVMDGTDVVIKFYSKPAAGALDSTLLAREVDTIQVVSNVALTINLATV